MKYSIWLIPPEPVYSEIKKIIDSLSNEYGAPKAEPHLTVVGNIEKNLSEVNEKAEELAESACSLELSLGPVSFSTTFFQCVFVRVNSTAELMDLNLTAKKLLNMENTVFMPHISLLYGDFTMKQREKVASSIGNLSAVFKINQCVIVPSTQNPEEWSRLEEISFQND